MRRRWY